MYEYTLISGSSQLKLTGVEKKWQLLSVTGLNPSPASVNTTPLVGVPGEKKTGSKVGKKQITITLRINGDCELNRAELLGFLASNNEVRVVIKTKRKEVYIDGTVETNNYDIYTSSQIMQIVIVCEHPYFKSMKDYMTDSVTYEGGFEFPLEFEEDTDLFFDEVVIKDTMVIYNRGQIETGLKIELQILKNITEPKIYNVDTDEYFGFIGNFFAGDIIKIDTNDTAKDKCVLIRGNTKTKILNRLMKNVTWFKIKDLIVLKIANNTSDEFVIYPIIENHDEIVGI